jgi:hypothetical protein
LAAPQLDIGPRLRHVVTISPDDPTHTVREKLTTALTAAIVNLPVDLRMVAELTFNLNPEAADEYSTRGRSATAGRFLSERLEWCAWNLRRDTRTARRRFDEVKIAVADRLLAGHGQRDQRPPAARAEG